MKHYPIQIVFLFFFQFLLLPVYGQKLPCYANCNDLTTQNWAIDTTPRMSYGKVNPAGYKDVQYPDDCGRVQTTTCLTNAAEMLQYQVYFPANSVYSKSQYDSCPLPLIILFHPGAHADCSKAFGTNAYDSSGVRMALYCMEFAKRGFVAINAEYRRGCREALPGPHKYYSAQKMLAYYRAYQDARGMIRTAILDQREATPDSRYQIDTNNIFVGGAAAGATMAINLGYYPHQRMIDAIAPNVPASLGKVDIDFYRGTPDIDYFKKIKGVMSLWGNGLLPLDKVSDPYSFFAGNGFFPALIAFHGQKDPKAPVDTQFVFFSPGPTPGDSVYISDSNCLTNGGNYTLPGNPADPDLGSYGPQKMYTFFKGILPMEFYLDCEMKHGLDTCTNCTDFSSEFGTGLKSRNDVIRYIVQRSVTFFQAVLQKSARRLVATKFVECENKRVGCSLGDNNAGCNNSDSCEQSSFYSGVNKDNSYTWSSAISVNDDVTTITSSLKIFPNPAKDKINISGTKEVTVRLQNSFGQVILTQKIKGNSSMDVSKIPVGIYYIVDAGSGESFKVIKE